MQFSYRWLKELSGTSKGPEQLAKLLTMHSFEVEKVEKTAHDLSGVCVGEVVKLIKHPNADKLRVATVTVKKGETREIVCGAPNIEQGQRVAVALPGTVLPNGMKIEETKIRGVTSQGMICSPKELGIGEDHGGILILPHTVPIGASFAKHFDLSDTLLTINILPDRAGDALSYRGVAREIAALDGKAPRFVEEKEKTVPKLPFQKAPKVVISDKKGCLRYVGLSFQNVVVEDSPLWLQIRLIFSGLRPINNIVDTLNYLMLLTGQPMHAFDTDTIAGAVTVRRAEKGEKLKLLNGETKKLVAKEDVVIADGEKVLALAGIIGGWNTGVTAKTENVFVEIATFDPVLIRKARQRHGLFTDASYRFERGLDPNLPGDVVRDVIAMLSQVAQGKYVGLRDVYLKPVKPWRIRLNLSEVEGVLGTKIPLFEVVQYLALLGLKVKKVTNQNAVDVTVPTRRRDLQDPWDLIEEIGRLRGYDKIEAMAPLVPLEPVVPDPLHALERRAKEYLADAGFDEFITYSFYGEREMKALRLPASHHVELENPLSADQKYLRMNQLPLMLQKVRENLRHFESFDVFEWGKVFGRDPKKQAPNETHSLALVSVLSKEERQEMPLYAIKAKAEAFLDAMGIASTRLTYENPEKFPEIPVTAMLHPTRSACVLADGKILGLMGEFHPQVLRAFNLEPRIGFAGFVGEALLAARTFDKVYMPLQKFPYALRDISLTVPKSVTVGELEALFREVGAPLLQRFEVFDIYAHGETKNVAFHLYFGAPDRTLASAEMDEVFDRIVKEAKGRFKAQLRDK